MVVDGSVVMIENIVRHLHRREEGTRTLLDKIRTAAHEVQRPVFYAIAIIITAYLPIFTLQRVEGRLFRPMAWTVAFALLGALLFSMLFAPALASFLFRGEVKQWENPVMKFLAVRYRKDVAWAIRNRWLTVGVAVVAFLGAIYLAFGGVIGSEFLPHLDEGAIWVRGTLAPSTGPTESARSPSRLAKSSRVSRGSASCHPDRAPGRRHRHDGIFQHGVLRRSCFPRKNGGRCSARTRRD